MTVHYDSEATYQRAVVKLLRETLGWEVKHVPNCKTRGGYSNQSATDLLDLICVRPPRYAEVEVKGPHTKITDGQLARVALLGECDGVEVYIWRAPHPGKQYGDEMTLQQIADIMAPRRRVARVTS